MSFFADLVSSGSKDKIEMTKKDLDSRVDD